MKIKKLENNTSCHFERSSNGVRNPFTVENGTDCNIITVKGFLACWLEMTKENENYIFWRYCRTAWKEALAKIIPKLKKEYKTDLIIANGDNLAHGKGATEKSLEEVLNSGVDLVTSGDHTWDQKQVIGLFNNKDISLIRPANYPPSVPGRGYKILEVGARRVLIINLMGRVFLRQTLDCPFRKADEIIEEFQDDADIIIVDFHAEATSEKKALGYYLDGRVSAILGTHTHIPTADAQILPKGTAYITDAGMVGPKESILGAKKEVVFHQFLTQMPFKYEIAEDNSTEINGVFFEIDASTGKALKIENIHRII